MTTKVKHIANNVVTDSQIDLSTIDSGEIAEGSNLYFTNARVDSRLSSGSVGAITHTQGYTQTAGTWQKQGTNGNITIASNGNEVNFSRNAANYLNATGASASLVLMTNNQTALTLNSGQNALFTGDVTIQGQLSITGNIDQYNVTDLDVTDKTITLGSGQTEANSGGSGIVIDGSAASILWDEANDTWDLNKPLEVSSYIKANGALYSTIASSGGSFLVATHTGNEQWSFDARSGSGSTDYVDFGIAGSTRCMTWQEDGNVGIGNTSPSAFLHISKDNNNAGNQFAVADTEGVSPAVRTYTHNGDPAALILNHYYAVGGSSNEYMRYADFVANVGNGAGTTMRFITKNAANTFSVGLTQDNNGNVGIGTTAPNRELDVQGNIRIPPGNTIRCEDDDGTYRGAIRIGNATTFDFGVFMASDGANPAFVIKNSNRYVGIGTDSPTTKLDVRGGSGSGTLTHALFTGTTGRGFEIRTRMDVSGGQHSGCAELNSKDSEGTGGDIALSSNGNVRMFIDGSGKVGIGTTAPSNQFVIKNSTNPDMEFGSESGGAFIQIYNRSSSAYGNLRLITNGETMRLTNTGRVGIGHTSPNAQLHINAGNNSSVTIGNATNPALQIGGTTNYRFGVYTDNETAYIENKNGDDGIAFRVKTKGEAMRIDGGTGNVGIGTNNPGHPLHIVESADGPKIRLTRGGVCEWDMSISNTSTLSGVGAGALELLPQNGGTSNEFAIGQAGTTAALFHVTNAQNYFKNKVGIGINAPTRQLHVRNASSGGTATTNSVAVFEDNDNTEVSILGGTSSLLALNFGSSSNNDEMAIKANTTSSSRYLQFDVSTTPIARMDSEGLHFQKTDGQKITAKESLIMEIDSDNNTSARVFQVKGGNHSRGIHVANDTGTFSINAGDIATGSGDDTGYNYMQVVGTSGYMPGGSSYAFRDYVFGFSGNNSHTLTWDNTDSYFNAEITFVAACTNGGSNNNVFARAFWTNNHTSHKFAVIEGMTQTANNIGTVIVNGASGSIGALANGNTFVFTASQGTQATNSGKLTLVHSYPGGSFYGGKVFMRVFFGSFQPQNFTVTT